MNDIVRHPIVAELLDRYDDSYELGDSSAEVTLSEWLTHPTYEVPRYNKRYELN